MYYHPIIEELITGGSSTIETLIILLSIPVIFTIINIFKYFVGLKSISIYGTIASVFLFNSIGSTLNYTNKSDINIGLIYGTILISIIFAAVVIGHTLLRNIQLHYYPKISIILMFPLGALLFVMILSKRILDQIIIQMDPINMILLAILAEQILSIYIKHRLKSSITIISQSIIISGISYALFASSFFQENLLLYPWLVLLLIPVNILIGKYTGLRLTEYTRFYDILVDTNIHNADNSDSEE